MCKQIDGYRGILVLIMTWIGAFSTPIFGIGFGIAYAVDGEAIPSAAFVALDRDTDGVLVETELRAARVDLSKADIVRMFLLHDENGDGRISLTEWNADSPGRGRMHLIEFIYRDTNEDGQLDEAEFQSASPVQLQPVDRRDFRVLDFDSNSILSLDEFRCWPRLPPNDSRGPVPDPVAEVAQQRLDAARERMKRADKNGDGIDASEIDAMDPEKVVPGLTFAMWDSDANGRISGAELESVVQIAFGLVRTDGTPLRTTDGYVHGLMYFRYFDANADDRVTVDDFQKRGVPEAGTANFMKSGDRDFNGEITFNEWISAGLFRLDTLAEFFRLDKSLDGRLDAAELVQGNESWLIITTSHALPAFDLDGDGGLSFSEYRLSPLANLLVAWHDVRHDQNNDGLLSLKEFAWLPAPAISGLEAEYFTRLDQNRDGQLDPDEFTFQTSVREPKREFAKLDTDQSKSLSLDEFVANFPSTEKLKAERDFRVFDFNRDGQLADGEFAAVTSLFDLGRRGAVPNPVVQWMDEAIARWESRRKAADKNGDGVLSEPEFGADEALRSALPGMKETPFGGWDIDGDKNLTLEECRHLAEIVFGVRRPQGELLRGSAGTVMNLMYFKYWDSNGDDRVSREEAIARLGADADAVLKECDQDGDGHITYQEWTKLAWSTQDNPAQFLRLDLSLDGMLTTEELTAGVPDWQRGMVKRLLPAFDLDGDGRMNLEEYLGSPLANPMLAWHELRDDVDGDGKLSRSEFQWPGAPSFAGLIERFFDRNDLNRDGFLEWDEYDFTTSHRDPKREFAKYDKDQDASLTLAEFEALYVVEQRQLAQRNFRILDFDHNELLNFEEFRSLPNFGTAARGKIPDPVVQQVERQLKTIQESFGSADRNKDERLDRSEFTASRLTRQVLGLELVGFGSWDLNRDQSVTMEECRSVLEIAWGIKRPSGEALRHGSGTATRGMHFRHLDINNDNLITTAEMNERGGAQAEAWMKSADANGNGTLTYAEWQTLPYGKQDLLAEFFHYDTTFDGKLSKDEIEKDSPPWQRISVQHALPAFDEDRDGFLSLSEYMFCPLGHQVAAWHEKRADEDWDGKLGMSEFSWTTGVPLAAITREYFRRLDLNHDGSLDLDEYEFHVDPARVPSEAGFRHLDKDRDGKVTLKEIAGDVSGKDPDQQARLLQIEEAFLAADADGDKGLSLSEFQSESGRRTLNPSQPTKNMASTKITRNGGVATTGGLSGRFVALLAFNVLLVGGVAWYILFKR